MTAIEWLEKRFYFTKGQLIDIDFKQAKAIEKEQMNNAYNDDRPNLTIYESNEAFEQYYNETFKSE